jgi:glycerophosphoryl diester phosphodiesterase
LRSPERGPRSRAWLVAHVYAHRGLHRRGGPPENSGAAFAAALARGYGIEFDVRASADGEAMVFHDPTLKRMTGRRGRIAAMTAAGLGAVPLAHSDETIPTLAQVLALIAGRVPILIELKRTGSGFALERAVAAALARYRGPAAVMSFDPAALAWFARHAPDAWRGLVTKRWPPTLIAEGQPPARDHRRRRTAPIAGAPHFFACAVGAISRRARPADFPYPLLAWTVRSPRERDRARRVGAAIIFERLVP